MLHFRRVCFVVSGLPFLCKALLLSRYPQLLFDIVLGVVSVIDELELDSAGFDSRPHVDV